MEVFNKLKTVVTSALPGNPLSRDFDVHSHVGSSGPGMLWKIYNGMKKTTKQEVSVFVFEKKLLERYSKRDRDLITETLKRGVSQLTRLRHPRILSVLHPLEESRETLAFATEPVFASLANILKNNTNLPTPLPKELQDFKLYEVEIKYGLLQVIEGLAFLHSSVKMMHHNICPESIIVNKNGAWKISGFEFCVSNFSLQEQSPEYAFREWDISLPPVAQPNLDYLAPEYSLTMMCGTASDMFSLGVFIFAIFNHGKPLYECEEELSTFKANTEELRRLRQSLLGSVPEEVRDHVKLLLNVEPSVRPDPDQLTKIPFFEDVSSMTLQYLDTLFQRDNLQKSQFFKGLPKIVSKLPKRINQQRILPPLFKECVNPDMIPFVLPNILQVAEQSTDKEYVSLILPELIPMFKLQRPVQILLIFLQNMTFLLSKTPQTDIKNHVLPMVYHALEANDPQIQELCLNIIPTFACLIDYMALKNSIVPRIKKICLATSVLPVRVGCLVCIGKLLEYMDRWFVMDDVLPLLPQIPSREPGVLMSMLGILKVTLSHPKLGITKDLLANKVIPFIVPLCIDNNLNLTQFNAYITIVKDMMSKVESEQRTKLEQLNSMQQEQRTLEINKITNQDDSTLLPDVDNSSQKKTMMDTFLAGVGLGNLISSFSSSVKQKIPENSKLSDKDAEPRLPYQPAKVSLTLEEKQRLAKEQEHQQIFKTQQPLHPKMSSTSTVANKPVVKDLTATLLSNNLNQLEQSGPSSNIWNSMDAKPMATTYGGSAFSSATGMGMNTSYGSSALSTTTGMGIMPRTSDMGPQTKQVDLSAFDKLLPATQSRPSLNQMAQTKGMMGNQSMMMGQSSGMPPRQMMTAIQPQKPQAFLGGQSIGTPYQLNFPQQFTNTSAGQSSAQSASTDLADIFG